MVKLAYVEFKVPQKFDNSTVTAVKDEQYGALVLDGFCVYIGKHGFPITDLKRWIVDEVDPVTCPECHEEFQDARALGAHRWFRHKVKGERQK